MFWFSYFEFPVELPTADPSQVRSREKRQFEGLDSSSDDSESESSGDNTDDDSSDNTIKVKNNEIIFEAVNNCFNFYKKNSEMQN